MVFQILPLFVRGGKGVRSNCSCRHLRSGLSAHCRSFTIRVVDVAAKSEKGTNIANVVQEKFRINVLYPEPLNWLLCLDLNLLVFEYRLFVQVSLV